MDPRRQKLKLALWIMGIGMAIAIAWCAWQGWVLGRGYPNNTFLDEEKYRYSDFTDHLQASRLGSPYDAKMIGLYFPFTYAVLRPLGRLTNDEAVLLFVPACWIGLIWVQMKAFRPMIAPSIRRAGVAAALAGFSYAVLFCIDRGNIEMVMALLIGCALLLCQQRRFGAAATLIGITMWLKLYTALLLVVLLRRHHIRHIVLQVAGFFMVSFLALLTFSHPVRETVAKWGTNFRLYNFAYIDCNWGLAGSSSPWNLWKICLITADRLGWLHLHLNVQKDAPTFAYVMALLSVPYEKTLILALMAAVVFVTLVEREFFRRALLLLLLVPFCSQSGADYRLLYVQIALTVLILLPGSRRHDVGVVCLLALVLVPKKEIFLTYLGATDSSRCDVDMGVILNPLLLLGALCLLARDGWSQRIPGWSRQRYRNLVRTAMNLVSLPRVPRHAEVPEAREIYK